MTTAIEERDGRARFVLETASPLYQERLEHLGYGSIGDDAFATPWFERSPRTQAYYERFAASIEQMMLQSARLVPVPWEEALREFLRQVDGVELKWWLYGSAALAVRGLEVEPGDIDFNMDSRAAARIFDDLLITPVLELQAWAAKRVGRAFHHAIIEWVSDPHPETDDPAAPQEHGPFVATALETVEWDGHRVWVPPLSAQLRSCELRGLADRAELIRGAMRLSASGGSRPRS